MARTLTRVLTRLGRWPRRLAALACLVLALGSAVNGHSSGARASTADAWSGLRAGQVAVPVNLDGAGVSLVREGDHVGLLSTGETTTGGTDPPTDLVADHLLVLRVSAPADGADTGTIVVAADRSTAVRIAHAAGGQVVAVVDKSP